MPAPDSKLQADTPNVIALRERINNTISQLGNVLTGETPLTELETKILSGAISSLVSQRNQKIEDADLTTHTRHYNDIIAEVSKYISAEPLPVTKTTTTNKDLIETIISASKTDKQRIQVLNKLLSAYAADDSDKNWDNFLQAIGTYIEGLKEPLEQLKLDGNKWLACKNNPNELYDALIMGLSNLPDAEPEASDLINSLTAHLISIAPKIQANIKKASPSDSLRSSSSSRAPSHGMTSNSDTDTSESEAEDEKEKVKVSPRKRPLKEQTTETAKRVKPATSQQADGKSLTPSNADEKHFEPGSELPALPDNAIKFMEEVKSEIFDRAKIFADRELYYSKLHANFYNDQREFNAKLKQAEATRDILKRYLVFWAQRWPKLDAEQREVLHEIKTHMESLSNAINESKNCKEVVLANFGMHSVVKVVPEEKQNTLDIFTYEEATKLLPSQHSNTQPLFILSGTTTTTGNFTGNTKEVLISHVDIPNLYRTVIAQRLTAEGKPVMQVFNASMSDPAAHQRVNNLKREYSSWMFGSVSVPNDLLMLEALLIAIKYKESQQNKGAAVNIDKGSASEEQYLALLIAFQHLEVANPMCNTISPEQLAFFRERLLKSSTFGLLPREVRYPKSKLDEQDAMVNTITQMTQAPEAPKPGHKGSR